MYPLFSLGYFCSLFGHGRQSYYEQINRAEKMDMAETIVLKLVKEIREHLPRAGVPKLLVMLKDKFSEHGIKMGRDGLYHLLGEHGYLIRYRRRRVYTTDSNHRYKKYPNSIRELGYLTSAGQLWVSDITYLRVQGKFAYLSIITDAYSHKIIGYFLYPTLASNGPIHALKMASESKRTSSLIHHSDRGVQYCCKDYVDVLEHLKITISMTENGDPYENAIAERVNGIIKEDFLLNRTFSSFSDAEQAVKNAVDKYNSIRPHASCDNLTPVAAHECQGKLTKRWKSRNKATVEQKEKQEKV